MTARHDLDRELDALLRDGPTELPDASFDVIRDRIEQTRQRAVLGPWRLPDMMKIVPFGLGTAMVAAIVAGTQLVAPSAPGGVGAAPTALASASPGVSPLTEPLTQLFTSTVHGISLSYPEGWTARAATEPWTSSEAPIWVDPTGDILYDPAGPVEEDHLFLTIASQPIGESSPDEWVAQRLSSWTDAGCPTTPVIVDGAAGLIGTDPCDLAVAVTAAGRGYWIHLRKSPDLPSAVAPYDRAWFEAILATVQLQPEDATDAALPQTFTSAMHGISLSYPEGWTARDATAPWTSGFLDYFTPQADILQHPTLGDHLWIALASQPLAGTSGEQWVDDLVAAVVASDECGPAVAGDTVTIDGAQGRWCGDNVVAVASGDRGYALRLYTSGDDPSAVAPYDRAWFETVLATVDLQPEDATDAAP